MDKRFKIDGFSIIASTLANKVSARLSHRIVFREYFSPLRTNDYAQILCKSFSVIINFFATKLITSNNDEIDWDDIESKWIIEKCAEEVIKAIVIRRYILKCDP